MPPCGLIDLIFGEIHVSRPRPASGCATIRKNRDSRLMRSIGLKELVAACCLAVAMSSVVPPSSRCLADAYTQCGRWQPYCNEGSEHVQSWMQYRCPATCCTSGCCRAGFGDGSCAADVTPQCGHWREYCADRAWQRWMEASQATIPFE